MEEAKGKITAEDLYRFTFINEQAISPDNTRLVCTKKTINEKREYSSHLFMRSLIEGEEVQWTRGEVKDASPCWSPDGRDVAFVSKRTEKGQIWVISTLGGEPRQLTNFKNGAAGPVWSPNGRTILCTTTLADDETIANLEVKEEAKKEKKPLIVERLKYKSDGAGFLEDKKSYMVAVDVVSGEATLLTEGDDDIEGIQWSPDGKQIAFTANRRENAELHFTRDVFIKDLESGLVRQLTDGTGYFYTPRWSQDGKRLSVLGHKREFAGATLTKVWTIDVETSELQCISADWDVQIGNVIAADMNGGGPSFGAEWDTHGEGVYVLGSERGNVGLYHVGLNGDVAPIVVGDFNIYSATLDVNTGMAVVGISDPLDIGELYSVSLVSGALEQLTDVNSKVLSELSLSKPEAVEYKSLDDWAVQGWLLKPVDFKEGEKYPFVLEIHGGPHAMYGNTFFHELQLLAAEGYVVLYTNPRGSHGYGQKFVDACRGDYGGKDYEDLMAAVDFAVGQYDFIDESRLGVTGGSYGGFMTNWIVGKTDRFKAAVTQRSISNWLSFYGVSDIGYYFTEWEIGNHLFDNPEKLWQHSPLRLVKEVDTPLLIIHGERDFRCPIEQAEQLYVALKHLGKKVKFVRFPDSNHELSRSGDPQLRVARLEQITGWFAKFL